MVKRLALILVALSWISSFSVHALGLGSIDMRSTLNQRLDARIELLRVRSGELKGLEVNLAAADTFRRAGIDRPNFLTQLSFKLIEAKAGGKTYIHITSSKPITEPFLNFLIEVNWANGRLLREFTVLVDPPVLAAERKQRAVQAPAATRRAPPPRQTTQSRPSRQVTRSVPRATRPAPQVTETEVGGSEYGPTRAGDTLWDIAAEMRSGSDVSVPQVMMALLENNPDAFYNNNINNLKMGHVLRLENTGSATSISRNDAARMASMQWEEWKENRGMVGSSPSRTRSASARRGPDGARVKLVSPDDGEEGSGTPRSVAAGSDVAHLNEELSLAQEALDATRQESKELNDRMSSLTEQMETMQRLVNLKDNQLVALQNQLKEAGKTPDMPVAEATDTKSEAMAESMEESELLVPDAVGGQAADQAEMEAILSGEGSESQIVKPEQLEEAMPVPQPMTAANDGGIVGTIMALPGKLMSDMKVMGIGIALVLIIAGVVWLGMRRRKMQEFQESILTGQSSLGESEAGDESISEDASFMSDFAVSSMEGISTEVSDVDPVSEADVYLAYGRYKQAEELIATAIESDPDRADLKIKALEIQFAAKDKDAFELQGEMYKDGLAGTEHWAKFVEMGQELCPESKLFDDDGGAASGAAVSGVADTATDEDIGDLDFGDSEFADLGASDEASSGLEDSEEASELDFDLGMDNDEASELVAEAETENSDDNSLDFDLGDFETEESSSGVEDVAEEEPVVAESDENSLDFDLGSFDAEESTEDVAAELSDDLITAESDMNLDDNSLDFDLTSDDTPATAEAEADAEDETAMEITDEDMESELDDSLFADVDEVGTKLDLAKAYIDMGDSDGAKSILDEVMEEGDDTQKNEAEGLMQQMA